MKRTTFILIAALILTAAVCSAPAFSAVSAGRTSMTGVVTDVNSSDGLLRVDFDRADTYKIFADEAAVRYQGRDVRLRDVRKGDRVRVDGDIRSNYNMDAYKIEVIGRGNWNDDDDRYYDRDSRVQSGRIVTVSGEVTSVDKRRNRVEVSTNRSRLTVIPGKGSDIREAGRKRSLGDIRTRDFVTVTGRMETNSTMTAHSIDIGADRRDYGRDRQTLLVGEVTKDTGRWDRDLTVRTPFGESVVSIPKDASVTQGSRSISVHDINKGDRVQVTGRWDRNEFIAQRVQVSFGGYGRNRDSDRGYGYFGKIDKLDTKRRTFRLKVERTDYTVEANNADILDDDGDRIRIENLRNGQTVWVQGDLRGDRIYAERVGQGSYYIQRSKDYKPASYNR